MAEFLTFKGSWPWPLPSSGHTAYRLASLVDLCLHTKFHWNWRNFLWTNGRTDGRTDGHLRPALLGQFGGVDLIKATTDSTAMMTVPSLVHGARWSLCRAQAVSTLCRVRRPCWRTRDQVRRCRLEVCGTRRRSVARAAQLHPLTRSLTHPA